MQELFLSLFLVALVVLLRQVHHVILVEPIDAIHLVLISAVQHVHPGYCVLPVRLEIGLIEQIRVQINHMVISLHRIFELNMRVHQAVAENFNW